jgi:hypothetical protein
MRRLIGVFVLGLAVSLLQAQGGLTGAWQGQTPGGSSLLLSVIAKGAELTGTMAVGPEKSPIEGGKVSKNTFTFSVAMGGGAEGFTGEIAGDEIRLWMDDRGPSTAIVLKRVTPAK